MTFGLWTHKADGQEFLDEVNEAARVNNLNVYAIGGNHENWDHWEWMCENLPKSKGFAMARRRVLLAPKAHKWGWAGKRFIGAGGAVSVDNDMRLAEERGGMHFDKSWGMWVDGGKAKGPRTLWWDNEQLTDEDVATVKSFGTADYLFTHDCSNHTPWKNRLKPDLDSELHRKRIDEVIASVKPKFHFHGHMHEQYDWENARSLGYYSPAEARADGVEPVRTIGLEAFRDFNSWGVLNVEEGTWQWPQEVEQAILERQERLEQAKEKTEYVVTKSAV